MAIAKGDVVVPGRASRSAASRAHGLARRSRAWRDIALAFM
jgi:hypothetical protein